MTDFHERHRLAGVRVSINDAGATPAIVTLRLDQAVEAFMRPAWTLTCRATPKPLRASAHRHPRFRIAARDPAAHGPDHVAELPARSTCR